MKYLAIILAIMLTFPASNNTFESVVGVSNSYEQAELESIPSFEKAESEVTIPTQVEIAPSFESIEPYTVGSDQEWVLLALSQLDNSAEKIRLYNYLLRAHTYLLLYDKQDYVEQYNAVKDQWLNAMPNYDEETREGLQSMLDAEEWAIDIEYPLETPFKLSSEEFQQVYYYFTDANPQFFLNQINPAIFRSDTGLTPTISVLAYYAFANRRQETYQNILNKAEIEIAPSFESIEPYTVGSNQEWALWALSQLDNSAEKIRLYNYLLRAHTYLLLYDKQDYIEQYNAVKDQWLNAMLKSDKETRERLQLMLDAEEWAIDIEYPLEAPFKLSSEEFHQVYYYFTDANPQFFLNLVNPAIFRSDTELTPTISVLAYYAFANRRQETYHNILNKFDSLKKQLESSIDINNQYHVVIYVHDHVIETLNYPSQIIDDGSREQAESYTTILGYFGDSNESLCKGYTQIMVYLLNRLGIPTIDQAGGVIHRDKYGEIVRLERHAWNMVQLNNEWYFLDTTWGVAGEYDWFLKGRGENNDSHFLYWRRIAEDMIYPEASESDYFLH